MSKLTWRLLPLLAIPLLMLLGAAERHARPSLLVYDFNLNLGPAGNHDHVRPLGLARPVTQDQFPADVVKLGAYARHVETVPGFAVLAFVPYDFTNPASPQVWRAALPLLARLEAPLWVIVRRAPSDAAVRRLLEEMTTACKSAGIETVIYPHWYTSIETAAEASALIRQLGHSNLKNSLHTCHEIRSGKQYALGRVASNHAAVSTLVTIAGADANAYAGPGAAVIPWSDAIKPLDEGAFSLLPFLQGLHDAGYDGRVILHTFGITNNPGHLRRSLRKYAEYIEQLRP